MVTNISDNDTIVAPLSAMGEAAVSLIRLSGPEALAIASRCITLKNNRSITELDSWKTARGIFSQEHAILDQVLVTLFRAPKSFTSEDVVEIAFHGSPYIIKEALSTLCQHGARLARAGEFSERAFLNGRLDLAQAEAIADLIHSSSRISHRAAMNQLEGSLSRSIKKIREALLQLSAHIEIMIDHSDDSTVGETFDKKNIAEKISQQKNFIQRLIDSYQWGKIVKEGIKIAIIGKPNVGKSSLLNTILRRDRAIVTNIAGTTRDTIEESFDLLGISATIFDTAGIHEASEDPVETIGIKKSEETLAICNQVIIILDGSCMLSPADKMIAEKVAHHHKQGVVAINKCDLPQVLERGEIKKLFPQFSLLPISAQTGAGVFTLLDEVKKSIQRNHSQFFESQSHEIVTSIRHKTLLESAHENLAVAEQIAKDDFLEEGIAFHLAESLSHLGEITGETVREDILKTVFSGFCIGK